MNGKINIYGDADVLFAVYKDGAYSEEIPEKGESYYFDHADCTNNATATWNRSEWSVTVNSLKKSKTKCSLYFSQNNTSSEQSSVSKMEDLLSQEEDKETGITIVSDDNNIRYIGADPSNYVKFNCDESGNCETWRIIGLMDGIKTKAGKAERLLKIIRKDSLGTHRWDLSDNGENGSNGINEWSQSDLMHALRKYGGESDNECKDTSCSSWGQLSSSAQSMIEEVVWNTGTASGTESTWQELNVPVVQYKWERSENTGKQCNGGNDCNDDVDRKTTWEGKVGLMYPSDYGYATDGGKKQFRRMQRLYTPLYTWSYYGNNSCYGADWLYGSSTDQWTMTPAPCSSYAHSVFRVDASGDVYRYYANGTYAVRPVVYLKSNVKINGGEGTSESPYTLSLN